MRVNKTKSVLLAIFLIVGLYSAGTFWQTNLTAKLEENKTGNIVSTTLGSTKITLENKSVDEVGGSSYDGNTNWQLYQNEELGIAFYYPGNWNKITFSEMKKSGSDKGIGLTSQGNQPQDTEFVPQYPDPDGVFTFNIYSKDFTLSPVGTVSPKPIDQNWTKEQFISNMNPSFNILGYKKFGEKSVLTVEHSNNECSTTFLIKIYTPTTNIDYPNLIISLNSNSFYKDETILAWQQDQQAKSLDLCDTEAIYQTIADKIITDSYTDKISDYLNTALKVVNSN